MVNHLVGIVPSKPVVGKQRVGIKSRPSSNVVLYLLLHSLLANIRDHRRPDFLAAFQYANHGSLVPHAGSSDSTLPLAEMHIACLAADKGLIYFHFAAVAAQL